ncbi:unnamed protein product [Gordionus sp. m RMFG-2023]
MKHKVDKNLPETNNKEEDNDNIYGCVDKEDVIYETSKTNNQLKKAKSYSDFEKSNPMTIDQDIFTFVTSLLKMLENGDEFNPLKVPLKMTKNTGHEYGWLTKDKTFLQKGELVYALYKRDNFLFIVNKQKLMGFVPMECCRFITNYDYSQCFPNNLSSTLNRTIFTNATSKSQSVVDKVIPENKDFHKKMPVKYKTHEDIDSGFGYINSQEEHSVSEESNRSSKAQNYNKVNKCNEVPPKLNNKNQPKAQTKRKNCSELIAFEKLTNNYEQSINKGESNRMESVQSVKIKREGDKNEINMSKQNAKISIKRDSDCEYYVEPNQNVTDIEVTKNFQIKGGYTGNSKSFRKNSFKHYSNPRYYRSCKRGLGTKVYEPATLKYTTWSSPNDNAKKRNHKAQMIHKMNNYVKSESFDKKTKKSSSFRKNNLANYAIVENKIYQGFSSLKRDKIGKYIKSDLDSDDNLSPDDEYSIPSIYNVPTQVNEKLNKKLSGEYINNLRVSDIDMKMVDRMTIKNISINRDKKKFDDIDLINYKNIYNVPMNTTKGLDKCDNLKNNKSLFSFITGPSTTSFFQSVIKKLVINSKTMKPLTHNKISSNRSFKILIPKTLTKIRVVNKEITIQMPKICLKKEDVLGVESALDTSNCEPSTDSNHYQAYVSNHITYMKGSDFINKMHHVQATGTNAETIFNSNKSVTLFLRGLSKIKKGLMFRFFVKLSSRNDRGSTEDSNNEMIGSIISTESLYQETSGIGNLNNDENNKKCDTDNFDKRREDENVNAGEYDVCKDADEEKIKLEPVTINENGNNHLKITTLKQKCAKKFKNNGKRSFIPQRHCVENLPPPPIPDWVEPLTSWIKREKCKPTKENISLEYQLNNKNLENDKVISLRESQYQSLDERDLSHENSIISLSNNNNYFNQDITTNGHKLLRHNLVKYVVLYDFVARDANDLTLRRGDIVEAPSASDSTVNEMCSLDLNSNTDKHKNLPLRSGGMGGWMWVLGDYGEGFVPNNYIRKLKEFKIDKHLKDNHDAVDQVSVKESQTNTLTSLDSKSNENSSNVGKCHLPKDGIENDNKRGNKRCKSSLIINTPLVKDITGNWNKIYKSQINENVSYKFKPQCYEDDEFVAHLEVEEEGVFQMNI